jgi:hypothetical protein
MVPTSPESGMTSRSFEMHCYKCYKKESGLKLMMDMLVKLQDI